jgi:hypothetical protein
MFTHATATYPPAEMTECGKQLHEAEKRIAELEASLAERDYQLIFLGGQKGAEKVAELRGCHFNPEDWEAPLPSPKRAPVR